MSKAVDLILAKPGMDRMKSRSIFVYEGVIRKLLLCKRMPFISPPLANFFIPHYRSLDCTFTGYN